MPAKMSNADVEDCLRACLADEGYSLTPKRSHGQTGVDIVASKGDAQYHIEVVGYKESGPARAKNFFEAFFRAVSRLNDHAIHCVIAVSTFAETGLPARAGQHRVAWLRIADAFPELEIWLGDTAAGTCKRTTWRKRALDDYWHGSGLRTILRPLKPTATYLAWPRRSPGLSEGPSVLSRSLPIECGASSNHQLRCCPCPQANEDSHAPWALRDPIPGRLFAGWGVACLRSPREPGSAGPPLESEPFLYST